MKTQKKSQSGFTLLELLIVLTISGILLVVALPSLTGTTKGASVRAHHRDFQGALMFARSEAVSRNKLVSMCPSASANDNSPSCDTRDWGEGWLVFIDDSAGGYGNGSFDSGEALLQVHNNEGTTLLQVKDPDNSLSDIDSLSWNYRGFTESGQRGLAVICDKDKEAFYSRGLMLERSGRVIYTRDSDGDNVHESFFEKDDGTTTKFNLGCS